MTKNEIVDLVVMNGWTEDVYDMLHHAMMREAKDLRLDRDRVNADLRLIKKYADANKLGAIKDILAYERKDKE